MSASCASCVASTAFIRGRRDARSALSLGSGIGVSEVAAVRAEAIDGNAEAYDRTVARSASGERSIGGSSGGGGWKREGWDLSRGRQHLVQLTMVIRERCAQILTSSE